MLHHVDIGGHSLHAMIPRRGITGRPLHTAANRWLPTGVNGLPSESTLQCLFDVLPGNRGGSALAGRSAIVELAVIHQLQVLVEYLRICTSIFCVLDKQNMYKKG